MHLTKESFQPFIREGFPWHRPQAPEMRSQPQWSWRFLGMPFLYCKLLKRTHISRKDKLPDPSAFSIGIFWEQFFTQWDVFLWPVGMHTAGLHTDTEPVIDGKVYPSEEVSPSTESISPLTGLPSITIPVGLDTQGLPIGIQLIGRRWEDEWLLAIAKIVSQTAGDFRKPSRY